jgi:hypothetical protein
LYEEPLYDGKQVRWVFETTDLSGYVGHVISSGFFFFPIVAPEGTDSILMTLKSSPSIKTM